MNFESISANCDSKNPNLLRLLPTHSFFFFFVFALYFNVSIVVFKTFFHFTQFGARFLITKFRLKCVTPFPNFFSLLTKRTQLLTVRLFALLSNHSKPRFPQSFLSFVLLSRFVVLSLIRLHLF